MSEENKTSKVKNKKKCKSLSSRLKDAQSKYDKYFDLYWKKWNEVHELEIRIRKIHNLFPQKYYKIKYKMKSNSNKVFEYEGIHKGYFIDDAIENLKNNKTNPETFELLDFVCMGT